MRYECSYCGRIGKRFSKYTADIRKFKTGCPIGKAYFKYICSKCLNNNKRRKKYWRMKLILLGLWTEKCMVPVVEADEKATTSEDCKTEKKENDGSDSD